MQRLDRQAYTRDRRLGFRHHRVESCDPDLLRGSCNACTTIGGTSFVPTGRAGPDGSKAGETMVLTLSSACLAAPPLPWYSVVL